MSVNAGTRGIGLGIAECLARDGFSLVLGYNSNAERAEQASASLQERHSVHVQVVAGDIAEQSTVDALFSAAQASLRKSLFGLPLGMSVSCI